MGQRAPGGQSTADTPRPGGQAPLIDVAGVVSLAVVGVVAVATQSPVPVVAAAVGWLLARRWRTAALVAVVGVLALVRIDSKLGSLHPEQLGPFSGWAVVASDPQTFGGATRVVATIEGQRFETWIHGRARSSRARTLRSGDLVALAGERRPLEVERAARVRSQHVVGELQLEWLGDVRPGGALARSANRVRGLIAEGAAHLPPEPASLVRGLVIGDDADQPPAMIARFRASGLSHLTAVSGQNVALTVAAAGPLLRRARTLARWLLTVGLIGWFVVVTRAEPSVLRAGAMAALGATAFALGRPRAPARLLAVAVTALVVIDPLLVWSVGFWLSTGATAGVVVLGPRLASRLGRLGPLALPVGITLGAQAGVVIPSLLVFGRVSLAGTVANLLAVPVAGFVMFAGLPACLIAAVVPGTGPVVMAPIGLAARWIDAVATVAAAIEPSGPVLVGGWLVVIGAVGGLVVVGGPSPPVPDSARP